MKKLLLTLTLSIPLTLAAQFGGGEKYPDFSNIHPLTPSLNKEWE